MVLPPAVAQRREYPRNLATTDHVFSRLAGRAERRLGHLVAACIECNALRALFDEASVPLSERRIMASRPPSA